MNSKDDGMNHDPRDSQNQPLSEAERRRLESEIAKNEAERIKLMYEANEAKKRLRQKWYSGRFLVQATVGGLVASALLATWSIGYFGPILARKHEVASLDNQIQELRNELQRVENEYRTREIAEQNEALKVDLSDAEKRAAEL